jgi:hypothetical protein
VRILKEVKVVCFEPVLYVLISGKLEEDEQQERSFGRKDATPLPGYL